MDVLAVLDRHPDPGRGGCGYNSGAEGKADFITGI